MHFDNLILKYSTIQGHVPVLLQEVIENLNIQNDITDYDKIYVDCTLGFGGYTKAILAKSNTAKVVSFDLDPEVATLAENLKDKYQMRFNFINKNFDTLSESLRALNIESVDGIIADLGVSSMQLDSNHRGFSFNIDSLLDMRMSKNGQTARDLINSIDEEELSDIIFHYGGEKFARKIAKNIVEIRKLKPINTTFELAEIVRSSIFKRFNFKIDLATKTFQALRIYINDELGNLERLLTQVALNLKPGGKLLLVSFHELEDRIVKNYFNTHATKKVQQSKYQHLSKQNSSNILLNQDLQNQSIYFDCRSHKLYLPTKEEIKNNPRSRSARLRVITKLKF